MCLYGEIHTNINLKKDPLMLQQKRVDKDYKTNFIASM